MSVLFFSLFLSLFSQHNTTINNEKKNFHTTIQQSPTKPSHPYSLIVSMLRSYDVAVCALNACCQMFIKHSYHHGINPHTNMYTSSHIPHTCPCCLSPTTTTTREPTKYYSYYHYYCTFAPTRWTWKRWDLFTMKTL